MTKKIISNSLNYKYRAKESVVQWMMLNQHLVIIKILNFLNLIQFH